MLNKSYHSSSRTIKVINLFRVAWFATDGVSQRSENSKNIPRHNASIIAKCNQLNIKGLLMQENSKCTGKNVICFSIFALRWCGKGTNTNSKTVYEPVVSLSGLNTQKYSVKFTFRVFLLYLQTQKYDFCSPGRWINSFAVAIPVCMHPWIQIYSRREMLPWNWRFLIRFSRKFKKGLFDSKSSNIRMDYITLCNFQEYEWKFSSDVISLHIFNANVHCFVCVYVCMYVLN